MIEAIPVPSANRLTGRDAATATALLIAIIASRLPFRGTVLYHWDSINFARALDHFDVGAAQPHVPGYILYVGLGRLFRLAIPDPQAALVAISIASSGLAVAALYILGVRLFSRGTGLAASLYLATSPLFWFYGEVALPHCLDAFVVVVAVYLLYEVASGHKGALLPAALWLALTGGLRQQSEVFLIPLTLYAIWRCGWHPSHLIAAALVLLIANCAWLVPLLWLSGGYERYAQISRDFTTTFMAPTTIVGGGLTGLRRNLLKLGMYTTYGIGAAALPLLAATPQVLRASPLAFARRLSADTRTHVLLLWAAPSLFMYTLIHMGQQGLVFYFLPAVFLVAGLATMTIRSAAISRLLIAAIVVLNSSLFLLAPTFPLGGDRPKLLTADTLHRHDEGYRSRIALLRSDFIPAHTLILSTQWRFPEYYLPAYRLIRYKLGARWEVEEGRPRMRAEDRIDPEAISVTPDGDGSVSVIVFDDELIPLNHSRERLTWHSLAGGERLGVLRLRRGEQLSVGPRGFEVVAGGAAEEPG